MSACGCRYRVTSCDLHVFVDEAAEPVSSQRPDGCVGRDRGDTQPRPTQRGGQPAQSAEHGASSQISLGRVLVRRSSRGLVPKRQDLGVLGGAERASSISQLSRRSEHQVDESEGNSR